MADDVKHPARQYDGSRRQARARQTRRSILDAAIRLFTEHGYGATSLQAIADEAGVAVQTIYKTLENKPTILAEALDVAIAGDDAEIAVNQRDWMHDVWHAPTAEERLRAYAGAVGQIMSRASEMFLVVAMAARSEPRLAAFGEETERRRRMGAERVVQSVREVGSLAPSLSAEQAVDIVWLLNSPGVHHQLARASGWSHEAYVEWLGDTLVHQLLDGRTGR